MSDKIIDSHVHFYPDAIAAKAVDALGKFYSFVPEGKGTGSDYTESAKRAGVTGFFVFSVATTSHQVERINDFISHCVDDSKNKGFDAYGFAAMHQDYTDVEKELERCISLGHVGIKIHPDIQRFDLLDERFYRICEIAEGRLALCLHIGDSREEYQYSSPLKLAKVLDDFPKLKVIAAHLGGYMNWSIAKDFLWKRENLWYDLSSVLWSDIDRGLLHECINDFAPDRVMFGSDYPVSAPDNYLKLFDKLNISDMQREKLLYKNAYEFLKK